MQLYRGLRVLTAAPSEEEEGRVPHRLYGAADPADAWSVGRWLRAATAALQAVAAEGRVAVVVGGTGLYFRALTEGLAEIPTVPDVVREEARATFDRLGEAAFREALRARDPAAEARIESGDRQRLTRAFEVYEASGRPLSAWRADTVPTLAPGTYGAVVLEPAREALYARCDARLDLMIEQGALEEVRSLMARRLDPELPAMKALGVRELMAAFEGSLPMERAVDLAKQETRRYAKRQSTWFRNQTPHWPRA
jgi:tRNA dimethylallyltransferase